MNDAPVNGAAFPAATDFGNEHVITAADENGKPVKFVLMTDGRIARVREGKGKDVEKATMISGGDQSKYLTAMMAATIEVEGKGVIMEDLGDIGMKDYMRLQLAFADINF